ncbi:MAG: hypothetical protein GY771_03155, partial [bacterium]|nr:hypothetical protein [bacterium]
TADSLHARAGFYYQGILNKYFDVDGESQDDSTNADDSSYVMFIPIDVGYNFDNVAQVDIGLQLMNWNATTGGTDTGEFGLSDLWIKARGIFQVGPDWYLGPRLGFKAAIGDEDKFLSTGQHDIDFGAWVGKARTGNNFRAKANLGIRYGLEHADDNWQPGMVIYARLEPGFAITPEFEAFAIIDFASMFAGKVNGNEVTDSESMGLGVGVRPTYFIDDNNAVSAEIQYPVMGDRIDQELLFGFNYDAYIPF